MKLSEVFAGKVHNMVTEFSLIQPPREVFFNFLIYFNGCEHSSV